MKPDRYAEKETRAETRVASSHRYGEVSQPRSASMRKGPKRSELPFTVKLVRTNQQLTQAVTIRSEAYTRHLPSFGTTLKEPEKLDRSGDAIVFLAEGKSDNAPLGTMRVQTNFENPLTLETSIELPERFRHRAAAGVSRLAVKAGPRGRLVKLALFKALHRYCLAKQVEWILIGARPPLDETYCELGFTDVFEDGRLRPLASAAMQPHRIMCFEVFTAERKWHEISHPLYLFMGQRYHPDIEIFASVSNMWSRPRKLQSPPTAPLFDSNIPIV